VILSRFFQRHLGTHWLETASCFLPLILASLVFASFFCISLLPQLSERACAHAGSIAQPVMLDLSGAACIEFFLNRYQTLIGVFAAFSLALVAVAPVWKQVTLMTMQASLQAQSVVTIAELEIRDDLTQLNEVTSLVSSVELCEFILDLITEDDDPNLENALEVRTKSIAIEIRELLKDWDGFGDRLRLNDDEILLRNDLKETLEQISIVLRDGGPPRRNLSDEENRRIQKKEARVKGATIVTKFLPKLQQQLSSNMNAIKSEKMTLSRQSQAVRKALSNLAGRRPV
jgi:hypothetical protein